MGPHGHVSRWNDRFLGASSPSAPAPPSAAGAPGRPEARLARASDAGSGRRAPASVPTQLARLYRMGWLGQAGYRAYLAGWAAAQGELRHLAGLRRSELGAVVANLSAIAAAGELIPSRLPALFLTLERNRQWWSAGPLLGQWQRVEFAGSQLVWEYYPGQGIELQVLASFAKANGLYSAGPSHYPQLRELLDELIPLAVRRAGGLAWEYYFQFDGGSPPWVSAMAQGTALQALARAAAAFGPDPYLGLADQALAMFAVAPPAGVRVATPIGARYLQYSFAPHTDIINAFLQSLIGLYAYAQASGDAEAERLFAAGNAQAEAELPAFDTGAWSLYQPGVEDSLSYHLLVTGFLQQLCATVHAPVYCTTAQHFQAYLRTPPVVRVETASARARARFGLRFALSKYSEVGVTVARGGREVFATSAGFPYGTDSFSIPPLAAGIYAVTVRASDLAGNTARIVTALKVTPAARRHRARRRSP
jgi:hypothetical protein